MKWLKLLSLSLLTTALIMAWIYIAKDMETTDLNDAYRQRLDADFIALTHGKVHYEVKGADQEPTVVLVHGFSVPSYLWDHNIDVLVEHGYRVIRFDLYGRGWTERPDIDYTLDLFVKQLEDLLIALKVEAPIHLVGLSMGGAISTRFAADNPEKIDTLSLLAPLVETPARFDLKLIATPGLGEYLATTLMMPRIASRFEDSVYDASVYPEWKEKLEEHIHLNGYRKALLSTARHLAGRSFIQDYEKLGNTAIPTQLIWGIQDPVIPVVYGHILKDLAPRFELHELDQSGHLPQIEQADKVNQLLLKQFRRGHNAPRPD